MESFDEFIGDLTDDKVKMALNTKDRFRFTERGNSVSIHYENGGYTSFFKTDLYERYKYNYKENNEK